MGVASGHRETGSNHGYQEQRRQGERFGRQDSNVNPITGEPAPGSAPSTAPGPGVGVGLRRPPSGNLQAGLLPTKGPLDHVIVPDKDVPSKRPDPTRNQSTSFHSGGSLVPVSDEQPRGQPSRVTEGGLGEGFVQREPTPEGRRRNTPGQVVRSGVRPKDSLSGGGCMTSDRPVLDHPMQLPRKAGSAAPGIGSGGAVHLVAGPGGIVPQGPDFFGADEDGPGPVQHGGSVPFKSAWGSA